MLLDKGVRPGHIADEANVPALSIAAKGGNPLIVRMLLDHGAEVNTIGPRGHTPFFEAVMAESIPLMEMLLDTQSLSTNKNIVTLSHSCSGGQGAHRERQIALAGALCVKVASARGIS
jgi:ankyrin repeat protein